MLEKLEIGFNKQGYFVTFGLSIRYEEIIKKNFPKAKPVPILSIGYKDVKDSLEPYREEITNYLLPLLTGLSTKELQQFEEISINSGAKKTEYLKIQQPYVETESISRTSRTESCNVSILEKGL